MLRRAVSLHINASGLQSGCLPLPTYLSSSAADGSRSTQRIRVLTAMLLFNSTSAVFHLYLELNKLLVFRIETLPSNSWLDHAKKSNLQNK